MSGGLTMCELSVDDKVQPSEQDDWDRNRHGNLNNKVENWVQYEMTNGHKTKNWVRNEITNGHKSRNSRIW